MTTLTINDYFASLRNDLVGQSEFFSSVKSIDDLVDYASRKGFAITRQEANDLMDRGQKVAEEQMAHLSDEQLDAISGGISWGAIGAIAGATIGAVAVIANAAWAAPALGTYALVTGVSLAELTTAFVGGAAVSATATAFSGAVVGGAVGAGADKLING
jgi:hypothetical protein